MFVSIVCKCTLLFMNEEIIFCFYLPVNVFNILDIKNVSSYYWITDVYNVQYAVPNYLTGRQLNVRLIVDF